MIRRALRCQSNCSGVALYRQQTPAGLLLGTASGQALSAKTRIAGHSPGLLWPSDAAEFGAKAAKLARLVSSIQIIPQALVCFVHLFISLQSACLQMELTLQPQGPQDISRPAVTAGRAAACRDLCPAAEGFLSSSSRTCGQLLCVMHMLTTVLAKCWQRM